MQAGYWMRPSVTFILVQSLPIVSLKRCVLVSMLESLDGTPRWIALSFFVHWYDHPSIKASVAMLCLRRVSGYARRIMTHVESSTIWKQWMLVAVPPQLLSAKKVRLVWAGRLISSNLCFCFCRTTIRWGETIDSWWSSDCHWMCTVDDSTHRFVRLLLVLQVSTTAKG